MGITENEKLEKVIKGLEICSAGGWNSTGGRDHTDCPYYPAGYTGCTCKLLMRDALALLKAQEPRLVTESDFDGADEYGYIPVWTEEKDGDMYWECIQKVAITDPDGIGVLRYWTSRPDEKRRAETPWES